MSTSQIGGRQPPSTAPTVPVVGLPQQDGLLTLGRAFLYPGLALTSLLLLRGPAQLPIGDILMACGGFCGLLSVHKPPLRLPAGLWVSGALLVVGSAVSSTVSANPMGSMSTALRLIYMVTLVPWILSVLLVEQRHVVRAVMWWLGGAAMCGLGSLAQLFLGDVIPGGSISPDSRFTGFTTHPNDLAGICCMAAAAALAVLGPAMSRRVRRAALAILITCTMGLILSGSVSGFLGMAAAILFLLVRGSIRIGRTLVVTVACGVVVAIVVSQLQSVGGLTPVERLMRTTGLSSSKSDYDTAGVRIELAHRAMAAIQESPFVGHGMLVQDNILMKSFSVHNNFLAAWAAGGVLLFLGVAIATLLALRLCVRRPSTMSPIDNMVATSVIAALAFAQTAPGMYNRYYWLPIAFAIFLAYQSRSDSESFVGNRGNATRPLRQAH